MAGKQSVFHDKGLIINAARADPAALIADGYFFSSQLLPVALHPPHFAALLDGYGPTLPVIGSTIPVM